MRAKACPITAANQPCRGERIAIIGAGATGTYSLHALVREGSADEIVVFETGSTAGPGLAYSRHLNDIYALSNIAGIETPPLIESLNQWARRQPPEKLECWGIADSAEDERAFFPRVVLGAWLEDQFAMIVAQSAVPVVVQLQAEVLDIVALPDHGRVQWRGADGEVRLDRFDRVIVASGYGAIAVDDAPAAQRTGKAAAARGRQEAALRFGLLGSSLSAIDAVVAIAMERGVFVRRDGVLTYVPQAPWQATMLSRHGLLPEADFWFPHPLPALKGFTLDAAAASVRGQDGDLDTLFKLFARALEHRSPEWAHAIGLADATADDFADRYFKRRLSTDPWAYARGNLADVRQWHIHHNTPAWRIDILKAHEIFAAVIPRLSTRDLYRVHHGLKRVFTDNYAAVPHLSIERILALNSANILDVIALSEDYDVSPDQDGAWLVRSLGRSSIYDELIDARGPQAATVDQFPFPTLRMQLCAKALEDRQDWRGGLNPLMDLTLGEQDQSLSRVHLCALPFLLRNRPFVQGLVECAEMAAAVSRAICKSRCSTAISQTSPLDLLDMLDHPSVILPDGTVLALAGAAKGPRGAVSSAMPTVVRD